jgi:hypothetical protein
MPRPFPEALLSAWEQGRAEPSSLGRSLALLGATGSDSAPVPLADLSIGQRDALLLQLHEEVFGDSFWALAVCEGCQERVEFSFHGSDLRSSEPVECSDKQRVSQEGYEVEFRMPTSRDLLLVSERRSITEQRAQLLERIVLSAEQGGEPIAAKALPEEVISAMEETMQSADPRGEVSLRLRCQSCGHEWSAWFDAGTFLWKKFDTWALRLLQEVHVLARAYGWSERDIIGMTPWRRHAYLEMLGA